jgi:predicted ATPase/class 3 adenylate cyclase
MDDFSADKRSNTRWKKQTMTEHPTGTITFLFTDIEGSTQLWEEHPHAMKTALARHDALLHQIFEAHHGYVFKTVGDAFCVAFIESSDALSAALEASHALQRGRCETIGRLRVRIALHTGTAEERDGDYFGPTLNRCARLLSIAHGDQVLLSAATEALARHHLPSKVSLRDLGEHRLRDLAKSEHVFQVLHPELPSKFPVLRSLNVIPNNLPLQLTSFIGRERELSEIKALISDVGAKHASPVLVTLTGAGGCGKTRLSLQIGADLSEKFSDGIWIVELASLTDSSLVAQAIASSLSVREQEGRSIINVLLDYLQTKELLLILDNCEHVLAECARIVNALLRRCPKLHILASSRESLNIAGEVTYPILPLPLPDLRSSPATQPERISLLMQCESVKLFVERACALVPTFSMTSQNALTVAQICQRLDGIPLAIELAAARVKALSVEQIAARLDDCFKLLTGGSRTALPRQQTLRAAMDWGYDLLVESERALLRRLSVFVSGFTLESAEAVCGETMKGLSLWVQNSEVLDLLTNLVDKSLVLVEERDREMRYRLLDTVRQYARDKLLEAHESEIFRRRHRDYFLKMAEQAEVRIQGREQEAWLKKIEREHDNFRNALDWSWTVGETEIALRLAGGLWFFWHVHGDWSEGRSCLEGALAASKGNESPAARARVIHGAGVLAWRQGDYERASELIEKSWGLYRELGDKQQLAYAPNVLGLIKHHQGDDARARVLLEESLALFRELGDKRGIAYSLNILGLIAHRQGDNDRAAKLCEEGLALRRELNDKRGVALVLRLLGGVVLHQGDLKKSAALYKECLELFRELGDKWGIANTLWQLGRLMFYLSDVAQARVLYRESLVRQHELGNKSEISSCLEGLASVANAHKEFKRALVLLGAAEALREQIGAPLPLADRADYDHQVTIARAGFDDQQHSILWKQGREMPLEQAIVYALEKKSHG